MVLDKTSSFGKLLPQFIAGFGVTLIMFEIGIIVGWTSPYLARLTAPDSPIPLTLNEVSWVASIFNLGRFAGIFLAVYCINYFGSKNALLINLFPIIVCWVSTMLAESPILLYFARFCAGAGLGMTFTAFPFFIGEISLPEIRGALVSMVIFGGTIGTTIGNICGSFLSLELYAAIYLVPCLFLVVLFLWLPETHHHLIKANKLEQGKKAIEFYRAGQKVDEEFNAVSKFVSSVRSQTYREKIEEFRKPALKRAFTLTIVLFLFLQFSGNNSIAFYMELILKQAKSYMIEPSVAVMWISASSVLASLSTIFTMDRFGRRLILIISSLGITIAMVGLGIHFYLLEDGEDVSDIQWVPLISMFLFIIAFFAGLVSVPSVVLGEIFPPSVKALAALGASLIGALIAFGSTKSYQPMIDWIGQSNVYFFHAIVTFLAIPYAIFFMPETKGKSLQEIQDQLVKR